ncbi:LamG domain-containing protein, partial [Candidatus Roizmanbacteria bacterium]|nr:LamG domain-containing protein [Candidatus Roizmanbacteria bacterium]
MIIKRHKKRKVSLLIYILSFVALVGFSTLLFFLFKKLSVKPPVNYSFKSAPFNSGYTLFNDNKESANFTVLVGKNSTPKVPSARFEVKDASVDFSLANSQGKTGFQSVKDVVTWQNVLPSTDVRYKILPDGLKEEFIIKDKSQAEKTLKGHERYTFSFPLNTKNVFPRKDIAGKLTPVFMDEKTKEYRFHMEKPFLLDAKGVRFDLEYNLDVIASEAKQSIESNSYTLSVTLPREWMTDSSRAYPVILDPTVTHNTQTAFALGTLNRVKDEGTADATPLLTTTYHELAADINTVGLWHMNEASGNFVDSTGNGLTGTVIGTTVVAGKLGNGRSFNGTASDYATIAGSGLLDTQRLTIEAWVYSTNFGQQGMIFEKSATGAYNTQYSLYLDSGVITFQTTNNTGTTVWQAIATSSTTISNSNWNHIAATYDGANKNIYVNGILVSSVAYTQILATNPAGTSAIGRLVGGPYYFNGIIDEVRVSRIARTPEEIKQDAQRLPYSVYTSSVINLTQATSANTFTWMGKGIRTADGETPISTNGLVAQWNLNEASGVTAASAGSCGATCNGTLTNFASTASQDQAVGTGWTADNKRWGSGAVMFDGSNDYIISPSLGTPPSQISVEMWFNPSNSNGVLQTWLGTTTINSGYHATGLELVGGVLYGRIFNLSCVNLGTVTTGRWNHAVLLYNGTAVTGYLNGVQGASSTGSITLPNPMYMALGATDSTNCGSGAYYNGAIDSTRIYSRALTGAEILANYSAGNIEFQTRTGSDSTPDDGPGLVGQWNFNEPSGITLSNLASTTCGSSCNGTLAGFTNTTAPDALAGSGWTAANARWGSGALMFNGTSNTVSIADTPSLRLTTYTVEVWFKGSQQNEVWKGIIGKPGRNFNAWLGNANGTAGYIHHRFHDQAGTNSGCPDTPNVITWGSWHQVVLTNDGTTCQTFVDGILQASSNAFSGPLIADNTPVIFGSNLDGGASNYFNGTIDSARIYSRGMSAEEVSANYAAGNLELQARSNGSGWEDWKPITNETQLLSLDSDAVNWTSSNSNMLTVSNDSVTKIEGTGS